jgi:hypothetical protein
MIKQGTIGESTIGFAKSSQSQSRSERHLPTESRSKHTKSCEERIVLRKVLNRPSVKLRFCSITEPLRRITLGTFIGNFAPEMSECNCENRGDAFCHGMNFAFRAFCEDNDHDSFAVIFFGWVISTNTVISNSQSLITILSLSSSLEPESGSDGKCSVKHRTFLPPDNVFSWRHSERPISFPQFSPHLSETARYI